jgi:hypothetical protein
LHPIGKITKMKLEKDMEHGSRAYDNSSAHAHNLLKGLIIA